MNDAAALSNTQVGEHQASRAEWVTAEWAEYARQLLLVGPFKNVTPELRREMIEFLIAADLWNKDTSWDAHIARWNSNLDPNKAQSFSFFELLVLAIQFDRDGFIAGMLELAGYERARKIPTETLRLAALGKLVDAVSAAQQTMALAVSEVQRLEHQRGVAWRASPASRQLKGF